MKTIRSFVMFTTFVLAAISCSAGFHASAFAATPPQSSTPVVATDAQKKIEAFLRYYFALGPDIKITVGAPKELGSSGLSEVAIDVKSPEGSDNLKMYLTKDGRYLLRGEISDLTTDPLADNMSKIKFDGAPVLGDPKAPITVVEFSDFECPSCRALHDALRAILPNYPQVKVVFKDFPIDQLHPWARTAALAGRCAFHQDPKTFWKLYDLVYDNQDIISAGNAYDKMRDYAARLGLNADTFKSCMSATEAAAEVDASLANGQLLEVRSTPTVYVNGRRIVGGDPHTLQQFIDFEMDRLKLKSAKK